MAKKTFLVESDFAALAKKARIAAGKRKVQVARELGVSPAAVYNAEEKPELPLHKLRIRMIEAYSNQEVVGPVYYVRKK
ncbi:MAG: hypothetical protein WDN67_04905 [Candidatus Moraniibacteriota bacterium]